MFLNTATFAYLLFNFLVFSAKCETDTDKQISESIDFMESLTMSPAISAYVCGTRKYRTMLWRNLSARYPVNYVRSFGTRRSAANRLFVVDLACAGSKEVLRQAEKLELFKNPAKWLLYGKLSQLPDLYYGVDSQIFLVDPLWNPNDMTMLYKRSQKSNFTENPIRNYRDFSIANRTNLMGTPIKISIVITNPDSLNHLWDYRDTHIDAISKLNYILVNTLMDYLNASSEFMVQPLWGMKNSTTGLYNGMAGDLQQGLADLGGTPLFFTNDRANVIDYIAPTTPTCQMRFIFRAPPLSYVTNVFTLPFDTSVWHYCFVMVAVVVVLLYIIVIWEWRDVKFRTTIVEKHSDALRPNIFEVIMLEIGVITQQGSYVEPQSYSGRIITIFTLLTLMFLYTSYSANIVALLQSTTDSITTLEDLLKSRIKLGVEDINYARYYFETAQEPIMKAIYQQKVAPKGQKPNFLQAPEGIRRVRQGLFAFHTELTTGYAIISETFHESEKCGLKEMKYWSFIEPYIATQKRTPYKEVFKIGFRKLHEHGIQNRELGRVYTRKPQCHARGSNFGSVGLIDCYAAFLLFGIGLGAALLIFGLEFIIRKLKPHL